MNSKAATAAAAGEKTEAGRARQRRQPNANFTFESRRTRRRDGGRRRRRASTRHTWRTNTTIESTRGCKGKRRWCRGGGGDAGTGGTGGAGANVTFD